MNPSLLELLVDTRKELHMFPEISGKEFVTQKHILNFLNNNASSKNGKVAKTGILAEFNSGEPGPTVMFRSDIDALPIQEVNNFSHRSRKGGVSHKCGHDGHTAILLGLAMELTAKPIVRGKVFLLFQPAEENGMGAQAVLADPSFEKLNIDYVFALHNLPGIERHKIVLKEGEFTANVKSIVIKFNGKTSHAAEPEYGINPTEAIADLLYFANEQTHNDPHSNNFFLITPVYVKLGEKAYGISAGYGEVHLTIRSWSTDLMKTKSTELENYLVNIGEREQLKTEFEWIQIFHANVNQPKALDFVRKAAIAENLQIQENSVPFKWGEDFGIFTQKFNGAMFGIGAGKNTPALHNPDYDFPDEIIPTCVSMFFNIATQIFGK